MMLERLLPFDDAWERDVALARPERVKIAVMIAVGGVVAWIYLDFAFWAVENALRVMGNGTYPDGVGPPSAADPALSMRAARFTWQ